MQQKKKKEYQKGKRKHLNATHHIKTISEAGAPAKCSFEESLAPVRGSTSCFFWKGREKGEREFFFFESECFFIFDVVSLIFFDAVLR